MAPITPITAYNTTKHKSSTSTRLPAKLHNEKNTTGKVNWKIVSVFENLSRWLLRRQISLSFHLILFLCSSHLSVPELRQYTSKFLSISHYNPNTGNYGVGDGDFYFLAFCVILFTGLRASFIKYILAPLAKRWGISKIRDITRFSEQAWLLCYYSFFWTLGVYIYCTSKYFLDLREMFTEWPTRELPLITKAYILGQSAFWLQQLIVINIEARRKDHWQMLAHHIITILLLYTSYCLHLTRVANLVLILMDVVDIFFPLAKCLKYLGFSTLRDIMFGVFMLTWFLARHVFYMITMWSIWTHMAEIIPIGCYFGPQDNLTGPIPLPEHGWLHILEPFRNPSGMICYSDNVRWGFLGALGFLQLLTIFWFVLIVRVAIRVAKGIGADDIRSDDDGGDTDEKESDCDLEDNQPHEVTLDNDVSEMWKRRADTRRTASSSSVRLTKNCDRKELLSRVGCGNEVD